MKKVYGLFFVCVMFFILSSFAVAQPHERRQDKFGEIESVLLRGIRVDLNKKQAIKVERIFADYRSDVAKIIKSDLKKSKKKKLILKEQRRRNKALRRILNKNQQKVYEKNVIILENNNKKLGLDPEVGIEITIID